MPSHKPLRGHRTKLTDISIQCKGIDVAKQAVRNANNKLLGWVEARSEEWHKATDANNCLLGYFDPRRGAAIDPSNRALARSNILTGLIYDQR